MPTFRSILISSALIGLIAGSLVTALQLFGTSPLIAKAEVYEKAGMAEPQAVQAQPHDHDHAASAHDHGAGEGWEPQDGAQRDGFTLVANILTTTGYALVITSLIAIRGLRVGWRQGLLWGLAGFACVMLAPMAGLPPELPGTPSAPLADRQLWWVATALSTAISLGLLAFHRRGWSLLLAAVLLLLPHLVGAPISPPGPAAAPEALERAFVIATVLTSLAAWLILGALSGPMLRRFADD